MTMTMTKDAHALPSDDEQGRLLVALQQLLEISATSLHDALTQTAQLLVEALQADKFDAFLYDPAIDSLVAIGVSDTPMGHHQRALGLDRLPVTNGGRAVEVFQTGSPFRDDDVEHDASELPGIRYGLGVRSSLSVALEVNGVRRGVLHATSAQPGLFTERDQRFLQGVARWVGSVAHRGELAEQLVAAAAEQSRRTVAEELITVLAHDLRNLLTPLKGRIELIRRRADREDRVEDSHDAEALGHSVTGLDRLIGDLLDVGRLDQGIFAINPQPMDLVELAQETAARFASAEREVRVEGPVELVLVADPDRLRQALENVLANALTSFARGGTGGRRHHAGAARRRSLGRTQRAGSGTGDCAGAAAPVVHALCRGDAIDGPRARAISGPQHRGGAWGDADGDLDAGRGGVLPVRSTDRGAASFPWLARRPRGAHAVAGEDDSSGRDPPGAVSGLSASLGHGPVRAHRL